jgi:hypothetical protein
MSDFGADTRHDLDVAFYVRWLQMQSFSAGLKSRGSGTRSVLEIINCRIFENAKDACHNSLLGSLLGADCSVVNPTGRCSGTSSYAQGKPQTGHGQ